jgi:hypothetical protein
MQINSLILQAFVTWLLKRFLAHEICGGSSAPSLVGLRADGRGARGKPPFFSLARRQLRDKFCTGEARLRKRGAGNHIIWGADAELVLIAASYRT